MTNSKDIISQLKQVKAEKGLSLGDIIKIMAGKGSTVSKSTLSRLFADGSEEVNFDYEFTIRPIAEALLDIDTIEETDNADTKAMKFFLQYKKEVIEELENRIRDMEASFAKERNELNDKRDAERAQWQKSIDFLKDQVALKDKRMDLLLESVARKDELYQQLLEKILECPNYRRKECE